MQINRMVAQTHGHITEIILNKFQNSAGFIFGS